MMHSVLTVAEMPMTQAFCSTWRHASSSTKRHPIGIAAMAATFTVNFAAILPEVSGIVSIIGARHQYHEFGRSG